MKHRFTAAVSAGILAVSYMPVSAAAESAALLRSFLCCDGTLSAQQAEAADINGDGRLDARDLSLLLRHSEENTATPVWQDDFEGDTLNMQNWSYELGNWKLDADGNYVTGGWGNNEQEFYTDKNTTVHDGILTIAARQEAYSDAVQGDYQYTSARLSTQHKFSVCGGRIEVRARCDSGKSLWPAIWMLPEEDLYGGWAASGEIDIMEGWGSTPEKICGTIHYGAQWPDNRYSTENFVFPAGSSTADWHTYAVEWTSSEMRWYVDDICYSTKTEWDSVGFHENAPFDQNFYIILNLAVGGHFDGIDGIYADPATFADGDKHFDIDYVRVYDNGLAFSPPDSTSLPLELYTEGADAALTNSDGKTVLEIRNTGEKEYAVMGLIRGKQTKADTTYNFQFLASSDVPREMIVTAEDADYTRYLEEHIMLTAESKEYHLAMNADAARKLDLKFQLGSIGDAASIGTHTVTLSDIVWESNGK